MPADLIPFERDVLRHVAGEHVPGITWGGAMGAALDTLREFGLVTLVGGVARITEKGKIELEN